MASRDVLVERGGGGHMRICGHVGVVELMTTANTSNNDRPRRQGVEVRNKRHTLLGGFLGHGGSIPGVLWTLNLEGHFEPLIFDTCVSKRSITVFQHTFSCAPFFFCGW